MEAVNDNRNECPNNAEHQGMRSRESGIDTWMLVCAECGEDIRLARPLDITEHLISQDELKTINDALDEIKDLAHYVLTNRDAAPDIAIGIEVGKIEKVLGLT